MSIVISFASRLYAYGGGGRSRTAVQDTFLIASYSNKNLDQIAGFARSRHPVKTKHYCSSDPILFIARVFLTRSLSCQTMEHNQVPLQYGHYYNTIRRICTPLLCFYHQGTQ